MIYNYDEFKNDIAEVCDATVTSASHIDSGSNKVRCSIMVVRVMLYKGEKIVVSSIVFVDWSYFLLNTNMVLEAVVRTFKEDYEEKMRIADAKK